MGTEYLTGYEAVLMKNEGKKNVEQFSCTIHQTFVTVNSLLTKFLYNMQISCCSHVSIRFAIRNIY